MSDIGQRLTTNTRATIWSLYNQSGWSVKKIQRELHVSRNSVRKWIKRKNLNDLPRNKKNMSHREHSRMKKLLKNGNSVRQTAKVLSRSSSYVYGKIRRSKVNPTGLYPYKPKRKLRMKKKHKQKRLNFILKRKITHSKLKKTVFADEKPFELGKPPNSQNVRFWKENGDIAKRYYEKDKHSTVVHCFAAISYHGKSKIRWYVKENIIKQGVFQFMCFIYVFKQIKYFQF